MSVYCAVGGHALVSTIGVYVEQWARRGGALPVPVALAATLAKVAGGLLALALVRPWGRVVPRGWLLIGSAGASVLLMVYGGLNGLLGALLLSGVIHPAGSLDRTALRWHAGGWERWILVGGILLALGTLGYRALAATGEDVSDRGVGQRRQLIKRVQVGAGNAVRLALVQVAAQPDMPVGEGEHRLGLGEQVEPQLRLTDTPRLHREG